MIIRPAQVDEGAALLQLMIASKGYWHYPPEWMASWISRQLIDATYFADHSSEVYAAVVEDVIVGFYSLLPQGQVCMLDDLWVEPAHIGQGVGRRLFAHALQRAGQLDATTLRWDAEPQAEGFYIKMGGRTIGEKISRMGSKLPIMEMTLAAVQANLATDRARHEG